MPGNACLGTPNAVVYSGGMTTGKDTNDSDKPTSSGDVHDAEWERFVGEHADDLDDVANSRSARKFERHARREEKKAMLSVDDLSSDAFVRRPAGPRDFTRSSWLDVDDAMDAGNHFTPPDPDLGDVRRSTAVLGAMVALGVLGLIVSVLSPVLNGIIAGVSGVVLLVGAAGLFMRLRGHNETRRDIFDDGSRV